MGGWGKGGLFIRERDRKDFPSKQKTKKTGKSRNAKPNKPSRFLFLVSVVPEPGGGEGPRGRKEKVVREKIVSW